MKNVNIAEELKYLTQKQNTEYKSQYTDGVAIKITQMSEYVAECYNLAETNRYGLHDDLIYSFYLDLTNNTLILYTKARLKVRDGSRFNVETINGEHIYVKIYTSREDFFNGRLANFSHLNIGEGVVRLSDEDEYFYYDNEWYKGNEMLKNADLLT
jgi:hypothetical protein